ncbi:S-methyl-5-thioribose-1-phosphate isomerase [Candidatus Woesearchaeota archaeon]|nr:S-methyl-5-thioribose-1-phosphate isomerase [Candidatus Woesearchaeota archaeon]
MKVKLEGKVEHFRTVWMENDIVKMIDQPKLPHKFEILTLKNYKETAEAIRNMNVRGAGAIGVTAGFAIAQAALEAPYDTTESLQKYVQEAADFVKATRPTAQNLFYAVEKVLNKVKSHPTIMGAKFSAKRLAQTLADEDANACKKIGEYGEPLLKDGCNLLTHCNAGWLAFTDYGSALSPVYIAKEKGKKIFVYSDETRPRLQGANLTAWELGQNGIEHRIIADNASGWLMQLGKVDIIIVGADRIAANGDTANKIGTYEKAVIAKENNIPFYIAAPTSTFDLKCENGKGIPIEERDEKEVLYIQGYSDTTKGVETVRISPKESHALNYAFDVTPAKYITGIITEKGIVKPDKESIEKLLQ